MSKLGTQARVRASALVGARAYVLVRAQRNNIGENANICDSIDLRVSGIGQGKELDKR